MGVRSMTIASLWLATACVPIVVGDDAGTHGSGDGSTNAPAEDESSASHETTARPEDACVPVEDGGPAVNEAEMASSMAAVFCIAQTDCDCPGRPHDGVESCRYWLNMQFEWIRDEARALGLSYDAACLGRLEAAIETLGCDADPVDDFAAILGEGRCSVYHGNLAPGARCVSFLNVATDCTQGLACWDGVCTNVCGDPHGPRRSPYGFACPEGQVLSANTSSCTAVPAIGDECAQEPCGDGAYCQRVELEPGCEGHCVSRRCAPVVALGDPCTSDAMCGEALCEGNVCVAAPATGAACPSDRCGPRDRCRDGVCEALPAICELVPAW